MNDYDQAARFATKINPTGFFGWAFRAASATLRFRGWLDTRTLPFPGEPDRICDTVAEFEDTSAPGRTLIAVVEFQSRPTGDILYRLWEYKARFLRERAIPLEELASHPLAGVLLALTETPQAG